MQSLSYIKQLQFHFSFFYYLATKQFRQIELYKDIYTERERQGDR